MRGLFACTVVCAILVSCGEGSTDRGINDSRRLYLEEKKLLERYIDSVRRIPDSGDVTGLLERYGARLAEINMDFPAETDSKISMGENDTLFMLTQRLYSLARKKGFDPNDVKEDKRDSLMRISYPADFGNKPSSGRKNSQAVSSPQSELPVDPSVSESSPSEEASESSAREIQQ